MPPVLSKRIATSFVNDRPVMHVIHIDFVWHITNLQTTAG